MITSLFYIFPGRPAVWRLSVFAALLTVWPALATPTEALWPRLNTYLDPTLNMRLQEAVEQNAVWRKLVKRRRLAVGVVDLGSQPERFASINGDVMMYAASLPKIAILLAAYASLEDGSLTETPELRADLSDMISRSSNNAATRVIDRIGMKKIEAVLRDPRYELYDERQNGGLWVGKRYAKKGMRRGDPLYNISHGATANQVCRFYYLLANGRLVNQMRSEQMLQDLADPALHHKFVAALDRRAPNARVFRKSGTWHEWHADSVLVRGAEWRNYILVAMVQSTDGDAIIKEIVPTVEAVLQQPPQSVR